MRGKITLIKALLPPKLTHILVSLPNPSTDFMKRLKTALFHFVWGGKVDRLQRLSLCKPYLEGGLEMIEVEACVDALKATWIRRIIKSNHSWTLLFQEETSEADVSWKRMESHLSNFPNKLRIHFGLKY